MVAVLIVEDDEHKIVDLKRELLDVRPDVIVRAERSVRAGVIAVTSQEFDLLILDLSLPTFDETARNSGGLGQPQGGLEVLRMLRMRDLRPPIIIVSQYYQVQFGSTYVATEKATSRIAADLNAHVVATILYKLQTDAWVDKFRKAVEVAL